MPMNIEWQILASAARTATNSTADQNNDQWRGMHLFINVSAIVSSPSVVFTISGKDPISATYYDILVSPAIVATGTTILKIYPGIGVLSNGAASDILPRTWRVTATHANSNSITYSIVANMVG